MNEYIRSRVRADVTSAVQQSADQSAIQHYGLRGRFRELLMKNVVSPWLPPTARCGTGTIIDANDRSRRSTQDDIIIYDSSLMPSILLSPDADEGVFPLNAVLARIEVKSVLTRSELRKTIEAAAEIQQMEFAADTARMWPLPASLIFAYESDLVAQSDPYSEWYRMMDVNRELDMIYSEKCPELPGPISGLCVIGRGCWLWGGEIAGQASWISAKLDAKNRPMEEALLFVGALSNSCFSTQTLRQGRNPVDTAQGGIGNFIISNSFNERFNHGIPAPDGNTL